MIYCLQRGYPIHRYPLLATLQRGHPIHWCHFLATWFIVCIPSIDALFQPHALSLGWSDIRELVISVSTSLTKGFCYQRKPLNQGFLYIGKIEVDTLNVFRSERWLGQPLRNICVANYDGYVPFVVSTSLSTRDLSPDL